MTPAETSAATPPAAPLPDSHALLKDLHARFAVFREHNPLAIGIDKQLREQLPDVEKKALRLALRSHTISTRYLKEMEKAPQRLNLDGTPAGEVTEENRRHAADLLRERFKKQNEQRRAAQAAVKAAEAAARAEELKAAKLNQLAEKFGRKNR